MFEKIHYVVPCNVLHMMLMGVKCVQRCSNETMMNVFRGVAYFSKRNFPMRLEDNVAITNILCFSTVIYNCIKHDLSWYERCFTEEDAACHLSHACQAMERFSEVLLK